MVTPRLPMSLMEASGTRARARYIWSPSLGCQNGAHLNYETGGALALNGRCSIVQRNNQPNDGVGGGGGIGEAMRTGGTRGEGRLPIVLGGEWSDEKKEKREGDGASDFDGLLLHRMRQQPTESRPNHWGLFGRGGAQCGDDWGGRGHTFLAIGLRGKK